MTKKPAKLYCLEVREYKTKKLVHRWEPMSNKRAYALGQLITISMKDGLYTQVVEATEEEKTNEA